MPAERAFIALGSNVGDRGAHLAFARARLAELPGTEFIKASVIEETAALGPVPQDHYLNQMVLLATEIEPHALLERCLQIEEAAGRVRDRRWGPRTLDLDLVRYGDRKIDRPELTVPHPQIANRPFWQRELEELSPFVSR